MFLCEFLGPAKALIKDVFRPIQTAGDDSDAAVAPAVKILHRFVTAVKIVVDTAVNMPVARKVVFKIYAEHLPEIFRQS